MSQIALGACVVFALALATVATRAAPLAKEECDKLLAEQGELGAAGVRDLMERGADWGKTNLSPEQLKRVERYIVLEEQVSFRCGLAKLRASLPNTEEGGEQDVDEKEETTSGKAAPPLPQRKPEAGPAVTKAQSRPAQVKARRAKPKVDDAYRPPRPAQPDADPFAHSFPARGGKP